MSTSLADLPGVNDLVDVTLDSRAEPLAAVISGVTGEALLLAKPMDRTGRIVRPETGECGLLVWGEGGNLRQAPMEVLETNGAPAPAWLVRVTAPSGRSQRRSFVRANVSLPVVVRHTDTELELTAVDLSEGGMRCFTESDVSFVLGDAVIADFTPGPHLAASATVTRVRREKERPTEIGLRFKDLSIADADCIRRYVFRQLHEERKRGAG